MHGANKDQGFDEFRKERKRMRAKLGPANSVLGYENQALRELEQVEAREVRDQQLTREVHDFFAAATRQAAGIVERVARDAEAETGARVEQEMESFLIDALARMNTLVVALMQQKRAQVAETHMEPRIGNLVGASLDEFRFAGTADVGDKHIGQDPFATDVDDVRREFRAQVGESAMDAPSDGSAESIEEHLVAAVQQEDEDGQDDDRAEEPDERPAEAPRAAAAQAPRPTRAAPAVPQQSNPAADMPTPTPAEEVERFKSALKALVRQGTMTREEARAAWQTRLQSLGLARS